MDWRLARVAPDFSHHQINGRPLYNERFDKVMKFHAPGLAPVLKAGKAWHIDSTGRAAYPQRRVKTFGFYEGFASVIDKDGAFHIVIDGSPLYSIRYQWTGNFQEGRCAVRTMEGFYHHIDSEGKKIARVLWRYAGDYKDGIAVAQRDDGLSTHLDLHGGILHNRWFMDLDVFHKGYARAKDDSGWFHIDPAGRPVYPDRYAMIEPFYNGQARVETKQGALWIIDENGGKLHALRDERDPFQELSDDLVGFWKTHAVSTAVELGIFEALPNPPAVIAKDMNAPARNCDWMRAAPMEFWQKKLKGPFPNPK
ncbi:Methyltransferase (fragment) [Candidatus Desulfarcum epimagneticum]|uniref:Methyltransferase n=1 Tax=uncultured Desulfobacteraceae bacterium TaxID=218296 RepID=A0A484HMD0_9BACT